MGEGEFLDVLLARSLRFMGSKREPSLGEVSRRPFPTMGEREKNERFRERIAAHPHRLLDFPQPFVQPALS